MSLPSHFYFLQRGWINSNTIVITDGAGPVVVDTGHPSSAAGTARLIGQIVDLAEIRLIVNTHCHWDHIGGNGALRQLSGAHTAVSAVTAHILTTHDRRLMWLDYSAADYEPVAVDITWQDGDMVALGAYRFEVMATPGHVPDSIALYQPETRLLISADALHDRDCGILNTALHGDHILDEAIATVEKLQQYDVALVLPGHGDMITDPVASLHALARRLAEFKIYPEKMALHLLRRVTMTAVLLAQPISRQQLIEEALARPWPHDYAARANCPDPEQLLHQLLDDFIHRGLAREQDGRLTSLVPR
ncbi:MAG: MBL fold metallo-hydrolase [Chloroflexi bacterium]|nr:MBL fold metallo-hydrolase [Ardenticatenaceae bacterium]MBL1127169.1 MBL fold metallo-hydrolase [Chloroflexota bacterium]NOG33230.1 MBL fold metallo-hydrolase [Chloroflexota bacterium]GIK55026.1 MAG: hypothetical protein BroJett015_06890 [Chloroflexota bacterium]